eukprot:9391991-Lingulodinium_polyedra.AAC.1
MDTICSDPEFSRASAEHVRRRASAAHTAREGLETHRPAGRPGTHARRRCRRGPADCPGSTPRCAACSPGQSAGP